MFRAFLIINHRVFFSLSLSHYTHYIQFVRATANGKCHVTSLCFSEIPRGCFLYIAADRSIYRIQRLLHLHLALARGGPFPSQQPAVWHAYFSRKFLYTDGNLIAQRSPPPPPPPYIVSSSQSNNFSDVFLHLYIFLNERIFPFSLTIAIYKQFVFKQYIFLL